MKAGDRIMKTRSWSVKYILDDNKKREAMGQRLSGLAKISGQKKDSYENRRTYEGASNTALKKVKKDKCLGKADIEKAVAEVKVQV